MIRIDKFTDVENNQGRRYARRPWLFSPGYRDGV